MDDDRSLIERIAAMVFPVPADYDYRPALDLEWDYFDEDSAAGLLRDTWVGGHAARASFARPPLRSASYVDQRPPGSPAPQRPRVPQPDQLPHQIAAALRRPRTLIWGPICQMARTKRRPGPSLWTPLRVTDRPRR
jgi:hypothetical protein